jgi:hypothetical protein
LTVNVAIASDKARLLSFVLPRLNFWEEGPEVFCFEGQSREGSELTLLQSRAGFAALTPAGLSNLLLEIGRFTPHKAEVLSKREFSSHRQLMISAAKMIVTGHSTRPEESTDEIIMKILRLPLMERMERAQEIGYKSVYRAAMAVLDRRYNPMTNAALRSKQRAFYSELTATFRKDQFQNWGLTGDLETDTLTLLSFF